MAHKCMHLVLYSNCFVLKLRTPLLVLFYPRGDCEKDRTHSGRSVWKSQVRL